MQAAEEVEEFEVEVSLCTFAIQEWVLTFEVGIDSRKFNLTLCLKELQNYIWIRHSCRGMRYFSFFWKLSIQWAYLNLD